MSFSEEYFLGLSSKGFHRIAYNDWGPKDGRIIIGVHGLTCNGHDFDFLAEPLSKKGYRFIAVDLPGRGRSDYLPNPADYNLIQYIQSIAALIAHLNITEPASIDFLGVSLGGMIGMVLAATPETPIARLIINDVGPTIPEDILQYIGNVVLKPRKFDTIQNLEKDLRNTQRAQWGPIEDEQWHHMAEHNARALEDGSVTYSFDPEIATGFNLAMKQGGGDLWEYWKQITCPILAIQGGQSALLTKDIIKQMRAHKPEFDHVIFEDCGHAPSLIAPAQIEVIEEWLTDTQI